MKRKWTEFGIVSSLLLLSRGLDVGATYHYSPDLKFEGNPLHSILGLGWSYILLCNAAVISILLVLLWLDSGMRGRYPREKDLSFWEFAELLYFGRRRNPIWFMLKGPRGWHLSVRCCAYVVTRTVIVGSFGAAFFWWVNPKVALIRAIFRFLYPYYLIMLVFVIIFGLLYLFLRREYGCYKVLSTLNRSEGEENCSIGRSGDALIISRPVR